VSIRAVLAATAALGFISGRVSACRTIHRLRAEIDTLGIRLRSAHYHADHDQLTGLPNRRAAAKAFAVADLSGRPTILVLIDLDRFKHINDTYGHHLGDDLLRTVAERLAAAARDAGGLAARLAGDEFLLLLPTTGDDPNRLVAAILDLLAQPTILSTDNDITVWLTASAGIAVYDGTTGTFDTMLWHADIALYHAKQHRATHRSYRPEMRMPRNAGRHGPRRRDRHPGDDDRQPDGEAAR
jgi:diguanylate cyclase (GGDEF)-like protein